MNETVIKVENLFKEYRLGVINSGWLVKDLQSWWARMRGKEDPNRKILEDRWSTLDLDRIKTLRDVSLEVRKGEILGIIGRNGAGKSTLLKILTKVTRATSGVVKIKGRVASLLEVGTGFHPELTGKENIYLNGTILGMRKSEIRSKFDEIVGFSEIEEYIDTPVKRYSSGMYVRLAFAVAAHLEPEILLIDEVLAVGDAAFQNKCLGKIGDVARRGRTVLFVSHNMASVNSLCSRAIVLEKGVVEFDGIPSEAIDYYLSSQERITTMALAHRTDRQGNGRIRFTGAWVENSQGNAVEMVSSGQDIRFVAEYESNDPKPLGTLSVSFALDGTMGGRITDLRSEESGSIFANAPSRGKVVCHLPKLPLNAGRYTCNLYSTVNGIIADWIVHSTSFYVEAGDFFGTGRIPEREHGNILFDQNWSLE